MTPAVTALIIFALFVIVCIWDKLPMATTAIAACALMVITGASNFSTAFGQYAASSMVLLLGIMVVGAGMTESGSFPVLKQTTRIFERIQFKRSS